MSFACVTHLIFACVTHSSFACVTHRSRRRSDLNIYLDLQSLQFSSITKWVTGAPVDSRENLFEIMKTLVNTRLKVTGFFFPLFQGKRIVHTYCSDCAATVKRDSMTWELTFLFPSFRGKKCTNILQRLCCYCEERLNDLRTHFFPPRFQGGKMYIYVATIVLLLWRGTQWLENSLFLPLFQEKNRVLKSLRGSMTWGLGLFRKKGLFHTGLLQKEPTGLWYGKSPNL